MPKKRKTGSGRKVRKALLAAWALDGARGADVDDVVIDLDRLVGRDVCRVHPLSPETHDGARAIAERYGYALYDASIIAAALMAHCKVLYSENLPADRKIEALTVRNPFHE